MNLLKLISHNDNKLYEEDILGALIGRRSQPREREDYKTVMKTRLMKEVVPSATGEGRMPQNKPSQVGYKGNPEKRHHRG